MMQFASDRLPLVIGVTGHRDLHDRDIPLLEQAVASVIAALRRDFLAGDAETPVMPLRTNALEALREANRRADQYRALGIFIARHCHVLLALWDSDEQDVSPGGAAEVVALKRDGIPLSLASSARECLDSSGIGPVIEILTPRIKHAHAVREVSVKPWGKEVIAQHGRPHKGWRAALQTLAHMLVRGRRLSGSTGNSIAMPKRCSTAPMEQGA
jgi:hypothetical protein